MATDVIIVRLEYSSETVVVIVLRSIFAVLITECTMLNMLSRSPILRTENDNERLKFDTCFFVRHSLQKQSKSEAHKPQSTSCSLGPFTKKTGTSSSPKKLRYRRSYGVLRKKNGSLHPIHKHQGLRSFLIGTLKKEK